MSFFLEFFFIGERVYLLDIFGILCTLVYCIIFIFLGVVVVIFNL